MTETQLQGAIVAELRKLGFRVVRVNAGRARVRGGWMHGAEKGTPDLHVAHPPMWLEIKKPGERLSDDQVAWHEWATSKGIRVETVRSVRAAVDAVRARLAALETWMHRVEE